MNKSLAFSITLCVSLSSLTLTPPHHATAANNPVFVFVDENAPAGGDGLLENPVQTIQAGVALLGRKGGVVVIAPGIYVGPILIDRDDVILWGDTTPLYDTEGYLAGFTDDVVITTDRRLEEEDLPNGKQVEDLVELRGSGNAVHNIVVDTHRGGNTFFTSALSAKAEDDDFYDDIVFSHILVEGVVDNVVWTAKANARIEYVTSLDSGAVGISAVGNGHVELEQAHIARKGANVCYIGIWEAPAEENGPSFLTGSITDCRLRDATGAFEFLGDGIGLLVVNRGGSARSNPQESSTIILEVIGTTFQRNKIGIQVLPNGHDDFFNTAETLSCLRFSDSQYVANNQDVEVTFRPSAISQDYANDATILVEDLDFVFPDPEDVDLGPAENGNEYQVTP